MPTTRGEEIGSDFLGGDDGFPFVGGGGDGFPFASQKNKSKTCGLIDFDSFQVNEGIVPGTWFLTVAGKLSTISMRVELRPVRYVDRPEYWEIEIVGCVPPIVLPVEGAFIETISITDYMGKKGVEVVGAQKREIWQRP